MAEMGRPKFEPTPETERVCSLGVAFGLNHAQIAKLVGCSPKTLRKHFFTRFRNWQRKISYVFR